MGVALDGMRFDHARDAILSNKLEIQSCFLLQLLTECWDLLLLDS